MKCPNCGLINPDNAERCDCGYDFKTKKMTNSYIDGKVHIKKKYSFLKSIIYFLISIVVFYISSEIIYYSKISGNYSIGILFFVLLTAIVLISIKFRNKKINSDKFNKNGIINLTKNYKNNKNIEDEILLKTKQIENEIREDIKKLLELKEKGILTDEEFRIKKEMIFQKYKLK